jgi:hypothetical protein
MNRLSTYYETLLYNKNREKWNQGKQLT